MQNESFMHEKYWDMQYENQSREESITGCDDCDGEGNYSSCCGARVINNTCTDCKEQCEKVICQTCKGDGVVTI